MVDLFSFKINPKKTGRVSSMALFKWIFKPRGLNHSPYTSQGTLQPLSSGSTTEDVNVGSQTLPEKPKTSSPPINSSGFLQREALHLLNDARTRLHVTLVAIIVVVVVGSIGLARVFEFRDVFFPEFESIEFSDTINVRPSMAWYHRQAVPSIA